MKFSEYLNESLWNRKKAIDFISNMEPIFLKSNIQVEVIGSVKILGESENDLDLKVIKKTPKSFDKLIKELKNEKNIERVDISEGVITLILKPDRKVVDIIFNENTR